uniref:Uncharacterized protein n=1 Tax=Caenorhabditis japonica TaxID=281687 RepID=A0A8R1J1V1_CAEJA
MDRPPANSDLRNKRHNLHFARRPSNVLERLRPSTETAIKAQRLSQSRLFGTRPPNSVYFILLCPILYHVAPVYFDACNKH